MSASLSNRLSTSNDIIKTSVAHLVRAAVSAREELSAGSIRQALENEFACDLSSKKDTILLAIQSALAAELLHAEPAHCDLEHAASDTKPRKSSRTRRVADELAQVDLFLSAPERLPRNAPVGPEHPNIAALLFACDEFDYQCSKRSNLTRHERTHSGERLIACDECDYGFVERGSPSQHKLSARPTVSNKILKIAVARLVRSAISEDLTELSARSIRHALEVEFACKLKLKKDLILLAINATLAEEMRHKERVIEQAILPDCKRRKLSRVHCQADAPPPHANWSAFERVQSRDAIRGSQIRHVRADLDIRPFACGECDNLSSRSCSLTRHTRTYHNQLSTLATDVITSSASTGFTPKFTRSYSEEHPHSCVDCDYRCARSSDLTRHARIHSDERPYACDECDYRCAQNGVLARHKRTHSGERPYACDECDFRCAQGSILTRHKRTHSGERPYACDECDFQCAQNGVLARHKRTHFR